MSAVTLNTRAIKPEFACSLIEQISGPTTTDLGSSLFITGHHPTLGPVSVMTDSAGKAAVTSLATSGKVLERLEVEAG